MATSEITRLDRTAIATSSQIADLTERDWFVDARSEASRPVLVERTVSLKARGKTVQFQYQDNGDSLPGWFIPVLRGFASLITLPNNWDGEGARAINREAINRALDAIEYLLPKDAPAPSIVPTADSGLQIEWHRSRKDMEIEFRPDGGVEFYYFDETSGKEHEGPVGPGFASLKEYLRQIW